MARFYDADRGKIEIGRHNVRELTCDSLLSNFSMVFQNVYLFHDTIRNDICFGKPDATEEEMIQAAISELTKGKTIIAIAHRLATIEQADQILVVDDGQIVQQGTHEELLQVPGRYRDFIDIRKKSEGWAIQ